MIPNKNKKWLVAAAAVVLGAVAAAVLLMKPWEPEAPSLQAPSTSSTAAQTQSSATEPTPTVTEPPTTESTAPTQTQPEPTATEPPVTEPSVSDTTAPTVPPQPTEPPVTEPPVTTPPATEPVQTDPPTTVHSHNYVGVVTQEATCGVDGMKTYTCSCGASYAETIKANRHTYTSVVTPPTCTEDGLTVLTCTCGFTKQWGENALGHSYSDWVTTLAATATEAGQMERVCATCNDVNVMVIPATNAVPDTYIDPKVTIDGPDKWGNTKYIYLKTKVAVDASWEVYLSISVRDDDGLDVVYYKQDGTKVTITMFQPGAGVSHYTVCICEDGSYVEDYMGYFNGSGASSG